MCANDVLLLIGLHNFFEFYFFYSYQNFFIFPWLLITNVMVNMTASSKYSELAKLVVDSSLLSENTFQNILENCFVVLTGQQEVLSIVGNIYQEFSISNLFFRF